jgi:hypothetical protein
MFKKILHSLMAIALLAGVVASSIQPAEAGRGGRVAAGVAAGIIGLGILGAYSSARARDYDGDRRYCHEGPRECSWSNRTCFYNRFGDYVCRGGEYKCYRRTYCD